VSGPVFKVGDRVRLNGRYASGAYCEELVRGVTVKVVWPDGVLGFDFKEPCTGRPRLMAYTADNFELVEASCDPSPKPGDIVKHRNDTRLWVVARVSREGDALQVRVPDRPLGTPYWVSASGWGVVAKPGSPLDDPTGEKIGGHSYDPASHNGRCPRCRGRAYVGLLSIECIEVSCEEWREPEPMVRAVMCTTDLGHAELLYEALSEGINFVARHPTREGAIAAWRKAVAR
jgi:hypothetical protein